MPQITIQKMMLAIGLLAVGLVVLLRCPPFRSRDTDCRRPECPAGLREVAVALTKYHEKNHLYPRGTYLNASLAHDDRLSWYADLMPHLDDLQDLHDLVGWNQRWNDGINRKISSTIVQCVRCTNQDPALSGPQPTSFIGIAGVGTDAPLLPKSDPRAGVFGFDRTTTLADIKDGAANTMFLAETAKVSGSWLQGGPATVRGLDPAKKPYLGPNRQFRGLHRGGAWVAMADGSVRWVSDSISPSVFEALSTIAGGESLPASR